MKNLLASLSVALTSLTPAFANQSQNEFDIAPYLKKNFDELTRTSPASDEYLLEFSFEASDPLVKVTAENVSQKISEILCERDDFRCPEDIEVTPILYNDFASASAEIQAKLSNERENAFDVEVFFDLADTITDLAELNSGYQVFVGNESNTFGGSALVIVVRDSDKKALVFASGYSE